MHLAFWRDLLLLLEGSLDIHAISLWVEPLVPLLLDDEMLVLQAPNGVHRHIVEERYIGTVQRAARALSGRAIRIDLVTAEDIGIDVTDPGESPGPPRRRSRPAPPSLNPSYTFGTFIIGRCNRTAFHAASSVVAQPGKKHNPLFVTGGVGLGKTHLLQAIGASLGSRPGSRCIYIPSDQLMDELMEAFQNRTIGVARRKFTSATLLLVDDIHFLSGKNQIQEEFFHVFNILHGKGYQIVLSSDRPPKEIPRLQRRLVSRFQSGSVVELKPPGLNTRVSIIKAKAEQLGIELPHEAVTLLASRIRTNIRRIEGALNRIAAFYRLSGRAVSPRLVHELLRDRLFDGDDDAVTIRRIQTTVADHFGLKMAALLGQGRKGDVVLPRQMAMYLCRTMLNSPYADIGAAFSGRDHATAIYSFRTIEQLRRRNSEMRETLDEIVTVVSS